MTKSTVTRKEAIQIYEWMKTAIKVLPFKTDKGEPRCEYVVPWDDMKVAAKFFTSHTVIRNLRVENFGHIKGGETKASIEARLDDIEKCLLIYDPQWREKIAEQPLLLDEEKSA